jgi:hypothetical protein
MKKYWKVDYRGVMPSIRGHRFHPNLFHATEEEMDKILDMLYGREDEYKIIGVHSFDTIEEYNKKFFYTPEQPEKKEIEEVYVPQTVRTLEERRKHREKYL